MIENEQRCELSLWTEIKITQFNKQNYQYLGLIKLCDYLKFLTYSNICIQGES